MSVTIHVTDEAGELALDEMTDTCALDVADRGEHTLEEVGEVLGVVRERVRQIVEQGAASFRRRHALARGETP